MLEQNGLIDEYTYWALEAALLQAKQWQSRFSTIRIAVNVSPQTLMHPDFINKLNRVVKDEKDGGLLTFDLVRTIGSTADTSLSNPLVGGLSQLFGWRQVHGRSGSHARASCCHA